MNEDPARKEMFEFIDSLPFASERRRYNIAYRTRDLGYGVDEGIAHVYVSADVDVWGKRTYIPADGGPLLYLFDDEVVDVEEGS